MKKIYTIGMSLYFLVNCITSYACDACGGITINQTNTDFSFSNKISFASSWNRYKIASENDISEYRQYHFMSNQISGSYAVKNMVQFNLLLPINGLIVQGMSDNQNWGLGDLSINVYVNALSHEQANAKLIHNLNLGTGITMPTGKKTDISKSTNENLQLQLSAESWSWFGKLDYILQNNKWSVAQINSISIYAKNQTGYRFGNIYNHSLRINLKLPLADDQMYLDPFLITTFEHASENFSNNFIRKNTGYELLSLSGGLSWKVKSHAISFAYSQPLWQKQNNNFFKKQNGIVLSYTYNFKQT